jgi:hypothetical protein
MHSAVPPNPGIQENTVATIALSILGLVVLAVLVLSIVIAMQPSTIACARSVTVAASPADVVPFAHDLRKTNQWSPWVGKDPDIRQTYSEDPVGAGASYAWESDHKHVGHGRMTLLRAEAGRTETKVEFLVPFRSTAIATLDWEAVEGGTRITWGFTAEAGFMMKAINLFMPLEKGIGPDYEQGLALLKPLVEAAAQARGA